MPVSKAQAQATAPFSAPEPVAAPIAVATAVRPPKSLTVKLDGELYADLVTYCYEQGRQTGGRVTHQDVMVRALKAFLGKDG